jgi:hypothetical protein
MRHVSISLQKKHVAGDFAGNTHVPHTSVPLAKLRINITWIGQGLATCHIMMPKLYTSTWRVAAAPLIISGASQRGLFELKVERRVPSTNLLRLKSPTWMSASSTRG